MMAQAASTCHLWDLDYSDGGKDFVYNSEGLHDVLVDNMTSLSKNLELSDSFWNLLLQHGVMDEMVQHKIKAKRTKELQAISLVHHIIEGEVYKFHGFIWALVNSHQGHLAEQLGFDPCDYLDMEVFMMSSSFRCPACHEFYTKAYILTGCGHYVCAPCVKGSQFVCKDNKKEDVTCPVPECGEITEASPSAGNINEDKDFNDLGEAVVRHITETKESELQDAKEKKINETQMKEFQQGIEHLGENISSLQKHRDDLEKHEAGIKKYIQDEVRKVKRNVDEWAEENLGRYSDICQQVEKKLKKSHQWQRAASELSLLMRARPGFLEDVELCLKDKIILPQETATDAAAKLITKLDAGCPIPLLCTPSPYKPDTSIPPAERLILHVWSFLMKVNINELGIKSAKMVTHWNLREDHSSWKLAWMSNRLMVLTDKGVWRMDLNTDTATCRPTLIQETNKAKDMSVAADGTWILSLEDDEVKDGIVEIHYPGLEEVKRWRVEGVEKPYQVFINNKNIFVGERYSQIIRSYSRELVYIDQYDIGTDDNLGYIHVTERGRLFKSSCTESRINTMDLETKKVSSFSRKGEGDGELFKPVGMCTVDDYILVCDCENNHVSIFTHDGQFLHHLDIEGGVQSPYNIALLARRGKPTLMALSGMINGKDVVGVYSLG